MTPFVIVIPARFGSSRLPAKPLAMIGDKPLVQWVYEQAAKSAASRIVIATDDQRIMDRVRSFGGEAVMTRCEHESGTDRIQEVATTLAIADDSIIVNVQGDEPLIPPEVINQVAQNLAETDALMATLCEPLGSYRDIANPNVVKVVSDRRGFARYFSRAPIPWARDEFPATEDAKVPDGWFRHVGIYAYRSALLNRFVTWDVSPLERVEKLEQLRVLWNGVDIHVGVACRAIPAGVDTADDLERVRTLVSSGAFPG